MYYCSLCSMDIFPQYFVKLWIRTILSVCVSVWETERKREGEREKAVYERKYMHTCTAFETVL